MSSSGTLELVDYVPSHVDELMRLWRESFEFGVGIRDTHSIEDQRHYFDVEVLPKSRVRIAFIGDRMAGFVAATPEFVGQLYVLPSFHRQRIGTMMLQWAKDQSRGSLWLYTFARNAGARAFYERHGFTIAARSFEPFWQLEDIRYEWKREAD